MIAFLKLNSSEEKKVLIMFAALEVNPDAIVSCRDDNYVLGLKIFSPSRRHYTTHLHHGIWEN